MKVLDGIVYESMEPFEKAKQTKYAKEDQDRKTVNRESLDFIAPNSEAFFYIRYTRVLAY